MGMKKALTRIFSKRKSQDGVAEDAAPGAPPSAAVSAQNEVVALGSSQGDPTPAVPRRAPLSGLDQLTVVLNPPKPDPQRALAGGKSRGASREARAATKIQAAYRGHLVRRSVRTHKSVVKVQALVRGHLVRRQAAITLRCMNALVRVQARARAHAVRNSATGREVQQHLEAVGYRQQADGVGKTRTDGWVHGSAPIHDLQADYHRRQTGFIKRERARAYAASFQKWKSEPAPKTVTYIPNDPDHEGWGWGWLERWMVARPWRNRSFIDATDLSRKEWAPPRRVVSDNGDGGAHLYRRLSVPGAFPAKVVDREEPNLARDLGEARQCKWCGRHSERIKDTEAGPLCGVCQLNTSTAARLNKDPYAQTGTKVAKQAPVPAVKAVEWEAPKVSREVGEVRQCKWCGRMSNRVKDTQGGPLCGVCQLNTATATRLNRDPYGATPPKVEVPQADSPTPSSAKTRSMPAALAMPRSKAATPSPTAPQVERRQSFPSSPKVTAGSPYGGSPASTPKSVMSPMGTPRFMQPTASSLPKSRTSTTTTTTTPSPSPRGKATTSTAEKAKQAAARDAATATPLLDSTNSTTLDDGRQEAALKAEPGLAADVDAARVSLESALLAAVPGDERANGHGAMQAQQEEAGEGTPANAKVSANKHVLNMEHSQGAEQAAMHSKSPLLGWPNSNGAPVIAQ